jgi:hypothetical protein
MVCGVVLMDRITSKFKGYRTWFSNAAMACMPILEMTEVIDILPDEYTSIYAIVIAAVNLYLRSITTTPLGKKL